MDALAMDIPDNSYEVVWACESGEHMPDKKKYVEEMVRVLKPGTETLTFAVTNSCVGGGLGMITFKLTAYFQA